MHRPEPRSRRGTLFCARWNRFVLANKIEIERLLTEEWTGQGYQPLSLGGNRRREIHP